MTPHLFDTRLRPGRRQTVVARAEITRRKKGGPFWSSVSLGDGRVYAKSTRTHVRDKALAFCRAHLMEVMRSAASDKPKSPTIPLDHTLELF